MNALPIIISTVVASVGVVAYARFKISRFKLKHADYMAWRAKVLAPILVTPDWTEADFFTEHRRKTEKLAALARYICEARALMATKIKQKKRHSHILKAIEQACRERLEIETGKRVWIDPSWELV